MAVNLKSLVKDTAIYGASSIFGRFLNYMLVPLYTSSLAVKDGGYGVITNAYSYTALILVLLTFGMETTFFRFANKHKERDKTVYSTALITVAALSAVFLALVWAFLPQISDTIGEAYRRHPQYVLVMATVVALDSIQAIAFSWLRYMRRPIKFVCLKLAFIIFNILLNLLYFKVFKEMYDSGSHPWVSKIYDPAMKEGYAFYINLVCTGAVTFLFWKELFGVKYVFDREMFRKMITYSWPLVVLGVAGILNQSADKILYPIVKPGAEGSSELSVYGAVVKIAMIMALITQAFRYAYEPIIFSKDREKNSKEYYAKAMKYFIVFTLAAFLAVVAWQDVIKVLFIRNSDYWVGMKVVPIVMAAEIMMGIHFNLSLWYKLSDKTLLGSFASLVGCLVLILINVLFIPRYGYVACAWGGFAGYGVSMLVSYFMGQHFYPINYPLRDIGFYVLVAVVLFVPCVLVDFGSLWLDTAWRSLWALAYIAIVLKRERMVQPIVDFVKKRRSKQ